MVSFKVRITDDLGLHLRPAGKLSQKALQYKCSINFAKGNYTGSVKSVLGLLAGGVRKDTVIELIFDGEDEEQAMQELLTFFTEELSGEKVEE